MKARTLVAVSTVTALAGVVIVAPAAFGAVPDAPGQPIATAGNAQISLSFPAASSGAAADAYNATCISSDGGTTGIGTDPTTTVVVTGLDNGHAYTCTVVAHNSGGDSAPSPASGSVTPTAPSTVPGKPAAPNVVGGDSKITVTFSAPGNNGGKPITGYTVRCTDGVSNLSATRSSVTSVTFAAFNGNTYTCTVVATNANGDSPASDSSNPVTPAAVGHLPDAPAKPGATSGDGQITVAFSQPASNGSDITSDTATCSSSNGGAARGQVGFAPFIAVSGLTNGKTYTCTVLAHNGLGDGPSSPASSAVIPSGTPNAPPKPSVAGGDGRVTVNFGAPSVSGGSPITRYTASCTSFEDGQFFSRTSTTVVPIIITGLTNGVTYSCNVTASNKNGSGPSSADSNPVVPDRGPDTPAKPAVVAGNAQIRVAFRAPGSGGSPIISYGAACTSSNGGRRSTKTGPTTPLIVSGLTNEKTYTCTVAARNARGVSLNSPASLPVIPTDPLTATSVARGFRLFAGDGGVFTFGSDRSFGSAAGVAQHLVVGMASTNNSQGYWLVATDGGIFSFGNAHFYGSTGAIHLNKPIVGMTPTPSGNGYWLVASDGGIFSYGDARFYGSTGAIHLNQPIVGMASTPTGHGYWMVASDGGIFSFGDAHFFGSPVGSTLAPVVGMSTTAQGHGYWIAAADGAVFHFGDAAALGGVTARALRLPVRGIASTRSGRGYWLATGDGGVFTFGDAPFIGWPGPLTLLASIRGVSR